VGTEAEALKRVCANPLPEASFCGAKVCEHTQINFPNGTHKARYIKCCLLLSVTTKLDWDQPIGIKLAIINECYETIENTEKRQVRFILAVLVQ
jgi:hypothetical protein